MIAFIVSDNNYCSRDEKRGVGGFSSVAATAAPTCIYQDSRLVERELPRGKDTSGPRVRNTALGSIV